MPPARRDGAFRERFHVCLDRRADALFELCDAAPGTVTGTAQRHRHRSRKAVSCGEESSIEGIAALCLADFDSASGLALLRGELGASPIRRLVGFLGARLVRCSAAIERASAA
jgi:hypothetical protein